MNKIVLPTGKGAIVIKIDNLDNMKPSFFKNHDVSDTERYVCLCYEKDDVKCYEICLKTELKEAKVLRDLSENLYFQHFVLKQI